MLRTINFRIRQLNVLQLVQPLASYGRRHMCSTDSAVARYSGKFIYIMVNLSLVRAIPLCYNT